MKKGKHTEIRDNLAMLADWWRVKTPGFKGRLLLVGGAALTFMGQRQKTRDVDVLSPSPLPREVREGVKAVAVAGGLSPEWLNDHVANVVHDLFRASRVRIPEDFYEISGVIKLADNLNLELPSRQTLITLKLLAASPGLKKHLVDLEELSPSLEQIKKAVKICLSLDNTEMRKSDLAIVLSMLGFAEDEVLGTD